MNFINYNNTLDTTFNIDVFMEHNMSNVIKLHEDQFQEEAINHYSTKQYHVLFYHAALEYSINLWFLILEQTEDESIEDSEKEIKLKYSYDKVQYNLAHMGIDLNTIFDNIKISYTPISI